MFFPHSLFHSVVSECYISQNTFTSGHSLILFILLKITSSDTVINNKLKTSDIVSFFAAFPINVLNIISLIKERTWPFKIM